MMWWILAGISVWAIIVFCVLCILRVAALSDRRREERSARVASTPAASRASELGSLMNSSRRGSGRRPARAVRIDGEPAFASNDGDEARWTCHEPHHGHG
jgi:hypothetical protein